MIIAEADLIDAGYEDTWKYFYSAYNAYDAMYAYRHLIKACLDKKKSNFESIIKGEAEISEKEKHSFPPGDYITVDGINMSLGFLVKIYTQSFFQFGRNCFDYIAQIIASFYCQDFHIKNIDFGALKNVKNRITDERVRKYIADIESSEEYKYLCDYNNTVKHNYDPGLQISMKTDNFDMIGKISSFEKNTRSYDVADMDEQMKKIHNYAVEKFGDLLKLIWPEKAEEDTGKRD